MNDSQIIWPKTEFNDMPEYGDISLIPKDFLSIVRREFFEKLKFIPAGGKNRLFKNGRFEWSFDSGYSLDYEGIIFDREMVSEMISKLY